MLYEVLYQRQPSWKVGETKDEAATRRADRFASSVPTSQYPGDYAGRIVSLRRAGRRGTGVSLRHMAGDLLQVAELELTPEDVEDLRNRTLKIGSGVLDPVTFDDRWGQVATTLRANFEDPEKAESETEDETSVDGRRFGEVAAMAKRMLPATITETGTGNYFAKTSPTQVDDTQSGAPAGQVITLVTGGLGIADAFIGGYVTNVTRSETRAIVSHTDDTVTLEGSLTAWVDTDDLDIFDAWSTIQAALDQLWTDQGSATFTTSQYVQTFAGTYDENLVPNASLDPDEGNGQTLIIEGDPADVRGNITVEPTAGANVFTTSCDAVVLRRMTFDGTSASSHAISPGALCLFVNVDDCAVVTTGAKRALTMGGSLQATRSTFTGGTTFNVLAGASRYPAYLDGCIFIGGSTGLFLYYSSDIVACIFDGCTSAIDSTKAQSMLRVRNSVLYNCTVGINLQFSIQCETHVHNTIFEGCTYNYKVNNWPEEAASHLGPRLVQRNNIYNGYTAMGWDGATTKTYAEWIAFNQVDDAGELDQTDPLLTDPANDDFSLQAASPARNTGHGSAATRDYLGIAFDPNHPDIGAWSSGAAAAHLTPVLESWANVGDGASVALTVSNVEGSRTVHAFYRLQGSTAAFVEAIETRVGTGVLTISGLSDGATYEVYVVSSDGISTDMPSLPSNLLVVTPSLVPAGSVTTLEGQGNLDLQLDSDCNDIEIVNLDLALVDGTVQVKQALCIALRMFRGEWFLDAEAGVPYYQKILVKNPDISEINSILKVEALQVAHVNKILEWTPVVFNAAARELSINFRVDTDFGPVAVEEVL